MALECGLVHDHEFLGCYWKYERAHNLRSQGRCECEQRTNIMQWGCQRGFKTSKKKGQVASIWHLAVIIQILSSKARIVLIVLQNDMIWWWWWCHTVCVRDKHVRPLIIQGSRSYMSDSVSKSAFCLIILILCECCVCKWLHIAVILYRNNHY